MTSPQNYPRVEDSRDPYKGFLDESKLKPHLGKLALPTLRAIIVRAIESASRKSSRAILQIDLDISEAEIDAILSTTGIELFKYFVKYPGDPAASAYDCIGRQADDIAKEQFHNRSLQKERMNSGWRYQFIARDTAIESRRFVAISDLGAAEADFNAVIEQTDTDAPKVSIYVSVKNRVNTMGGQDWPKAIRALEQVAATDKNRSGPYICIFGIAMDRGSRLIKSEQKTKNPYSVNTEVWLSDYFWPFFSNYTYQEIIHEVVAALQEDHAPKKQDFGAVPSQLIQSFAEECQKYQLVDTAGKFNDAHKLADLFVLGMAAYKKKYAL